MVLSPVARVAPDTAEPARDPAALIINGLRKSHGEHVAVADLTLRLDPGRVLALLGPNGAGKTTTVELCEGFGRPDAGEITVFGLAPTDPAVRPRVGVMLQGGGAYPGARTAEMLELIASYSADPLDTEWLLTILGLTGVRNTACRRLSGGQQQRLYLACAVVGRPDLVFLDEPTAGLDAQARLLVWDLIRALRRDGVAVLLTTHLMDEAESLADDVVIIDNGRVVAAGTPAELTDAAVTEISFAAPAGLDLPALAERLGPGYRVDEIAPGRYLVEGAVAPWVVAAITGWCADRELLVSELRASTRSLEDVFLDLTGRELR